MSPPALATPPAGPLSDLYDKLSLFQGQDLDLVAQLADGRIKSFLSPLGDAGTFTIEKAGIAFPDPYTAVTVSGSFVGLGLGTLTATAVFTLAADGATLDAGIDLSATLRWGWSGAEWLTLGGPEIKVRISDDPAVPTLGTFGATIGTGSPPAKMSIEIPGPTADTWLFSGTFPANANLSQVFQLVGGVNLAAALPSPLDDLTKLNLERVSAVYHPSTETLDYVAVELGSDVRWPLLPGSSLTVTSIGIAITVYDPAKTQSLGWRVTGTVTIGGGTVDLLASYPDPHVSAMLDPTTTISISDFVTEFVGHPVDLGANVTSFDFAKQFDPPGTYSISAAIDTDWSIPVGGTASIDITQLSFEIDGTDAGSTALISGTTVIGTADDSVTFVIAASYEDEANGWTFSARETAGKIPLVTLATCYLPSGWQPDPKGNKLDIEDLDVSVTPKTGAYSISGKADAAWDILGGFELEASAKVAYDGKSYSGKIEATLEEAFGVKDLGLHVSYSFDPKQKEYELDWQGLSGTYTVPMDPDADSVLVIQVKGWTLGKLVEELVSLATGASFSLASPWDLLDDIPLDCTLTFTLPPKDSGKKGTVSFTYPLSVDLGIAALSEITVTYDEETGAVQVQLEGRFPWQDDSSAPLEWDATDPSQTPGPPGGGSKYLELRVLALGQHVALDDPPLTETVKEIVDSVGKLAEPKPKELPVDSTAIGYSQASSWLIAADFGILKIDPAPKSGSAYFLDMALVFNDPNLYGLHVELEGPAAKIFAGLQFDISYRKVTDTVGVYQAELQLPSAMRQFDVGAFSFTLPTFAIAVYTNGDFELDVGFPWNNDFSRSFTLQGIVPPGIPVIGSGGFYFGKLSSATAGTNVPATTKGSFNPVIVFGIGLQVGVGKTFQKGPLSAGITVTVLGIVQGVIARWHPYDVPAKDGAPPALAAGDDQGGDQLQGSYYFKLQGTAGLAAHLYGSIDFAVVKASVDVSLLITIQLTYESYRAIPITVSASVDVRVSLSIDLGLFTIHLHFSFSTTVSETFVVGSDSKAPWDDGAATQAPAPNLPARRMMMLAARSERLVAMADGAGVTLTWTNLEAAATPLGLTAYVTPAFTIVGDGATTPQEQTAACVLLVWIQSVDPNAGPVTGADTSFDSLAKQVLRWVAAAAQAGPVTAADVDDLVVSDDMLEKVLATLADPANPLPILPSDVDTFLQRNAVVDMTAPTTQGSASATYFPMPPQVELSVASLGIGPYTFETFNSYDTAYISYLQSYFSELDVQVQEETGTPPEATAVAGDTTFSVASFVYADYFTMIARHMVEAARDALRDLKLPVPSGQSVQATVDAINTAGHLADLGPAHEYTVAQLFDANAAQPLTPGLSLHIAYVAVTGDTLETIAQTYAGKFTAALLATSNAAVPGLLSEGTAVTYPGVTPYRVEKDDTLTIVASKLGTGVSLADLIANSNVLTAALTGGAALLLPVAHTTVTGDTLGTIAASFGVPVVALGQTVTQNAALVDLFALGDTPEGQFLDVPHLPQYRLGDLIEETQQSLAIQGLSGMLARYFLHGVRLPTATGGTQEAGLFALTGQQLAMPGDTSIAPFDIALSCPDEVTWVQLKGSAP